MANEITLNGSLSYSDSDETEVELAIEDFLASVSTKRPFKAKMSVTTAEVAIGLGPVTSLGLAMFVNRDATNYLELRSATGAANDIIKILPGEFAIFRFGSDVTAPFAIANTNTCVMEYVLCSA